MGLKSKEQSKEQVNDQGKEPAAPKTASKGEGMDPTAVSRMLGLLKYRSDPDKNKKGQDMEEAKIGLEVYSTLNSNEKKRFLVYKFLPGCINKNIFTEGESVFHCDDSNVC